MYQRILVAIDGSPTAERGLQEAIRLAKPLHATLLLLHALDDFAVMMEMSAVWSFENGHKVLKQAGEQLLDVAARHVREAGLSCEQLLVDVKGEQIADVILAQAAKTRCDLIVMGTHGRRGLSRLTMGSDAELVLRQAPVPVLLVREP